MNKKKFTYKKSGVNINAADNFINFISKVSSKKKGKKKFSNIGGFGSITSIPQGINQPKIVACTDGVGTKIEIANLFNKFDTIGIDLVAMCVNDILVQGAEPLFFLDYFACGKLNISKATDVIKGISEGCKLAGCSLVGGETAEMPGMYSKEEYDLAGFCVGAVERENIIDGSNISEGDLIIGIASSGPHSNGYSLIRKVLEKEKINLNDEINGETFANILMKPTRIYVNSILNLIEKVDIHGLVHITGGGLIENIPRILQENHKATLKKESWNMPVIFDWLKAKANISNEELYKTFNCGIGMVVIIDPKDKQKTKEILSGNDEVIYVLGEISNRNINEPQSKII